MENTVIYNKLKFDYLTKLKPNIKIKTNGYNLVYENILAKLKLVDLYSQKYGLTLTFSRGFHNDDPLFLHKLIIKEFAKWNDKFRYIGFPEFSKRNNQLHYHFIIWGCYELEIVTFCKRYQRKFGIYKLENPLRYYYCGNDSDCKVKRLMLNPKPDSLCWFHYIQKDYNKNGLWSITNY